MSTLGGYHEYIGGCSVHGYVNLKIEISASFFHVII